MAEQNRFSTNSFKSQQSIEANNEVFVAAQNAMPEADEEGVEANGPVLVQEEDLQSDEVDCSGGECQLKRTSMASVTRVSVNLSRQSSQQQNNEPIVMEEALLLEVVDQLGPEAKEEEQIRRPVQNSVPLEGRPVSNVSVENAKNDGSPVNHARPVSLASSNGQRQQSMEEQKVAESPSNVEEKMLAQIRAKRNVANLIAKFSTANVGEETKENGSKGGAETNKQKIADNGGGAVNIKEMRQKFGQQ